MLAIVKPGKGGWGNGLVGKMFVVQACEPKLEFPASTSHTLSLYLTHTHHTCMHRTKTKQKINKAKQKNNNNKTGIEVCGCNPSTREAETEGSLGLTDWPASSANQ